jgi:hypothetical protein
VAEAANERRGKVNEHARLRTLALVFACPTFGLSRAAAAADFQVTIECPGWAAEATAQVDARIQASLLLERRGARNVNVTCLGDATSVTVTAERGQLSRPVVRSARNLEDDVVETVELALEELRPPLAATASAPPVAGASTVTPAVSPPETEPAPPSATPTAVPSPITGASTRRLNVAELHARALSERWTEHWAWGAEAGLSVGTPQWQYGLVVAGRVATGEPESFDIGEWSAAAQVLFTSRAALGLRGSLGIGASLFVTTPAPEIVAESETLIGSAFLELALSRPFWLGHFSVAPLVGARFFGGARRVRVNGAEALRVPIVAPQASLTLSWAIPLTR